MSVLHKSAVSLGFFGHDLDPAAITRALGGEPTVAVRTGGRWRTSSGAEKTALRGQWRIVAKRCEPADVDGQINALLDALSHDLVAWRSFSERYRGRIFCGLFLATGNEGLTLASDTLARLGERGLLLDVDIYGADVGD